LATSKKIVQIIEKFEDKEKYELNIDLPNIKNISNNKNILIEKNIKSNFFDRLKSSKNLTGTLITKNNHFSF